MNTPEEIERAIKDFQDPQFLNGLRTIESQDGSGEFKHWIDSL